MYATDLALTSHTHFIAGKPVSTEAERSAAVYNPATGAVIARVALAGHETVELAVAAARAAQSKWAHTPPLTRARVLFRFKHIAEQRIEDLAAAVTRENGKVLEDARGEVRRGLEVVEFACGIPQLLKGEFTDQIGRGVDSWSMHQPVGVIAGITPFNFPVMVPMWMWPLAIACGNSFILKPSEKDPGPSLLVAECLKEAGVPDGVFNVVNGDKVTVNALLTHPYVDAVSFVGSTAVAHSVFDVGSAHGKRVQALGGAKNHLVVMPDADLELTANALIGAAFGSAGERCMAISVVVAVGGVGDDLLALLREKASKLRVGDGADAQSEMGPLISAEHLARVLACISEGEGQGAKLVLDGRLRQAIGSREGFFLGPCIFDHVTPAMKIYNDEIFGPVLAMVRAPDLSAALSLISAHEYGNGAAIFTRSGGAAREFAQESSVGMVGINVAIPVPMAFHSFGGWKRSVFGAHNIHGPDGVQFYTRRKTISARWPESGSGVDLTMPTHQ